MLVDISRERDDLSIGIILFILSSFLSLITLIPAWYYFYRGLKNLKEKTNISQPYEYYRKYLLVTVPMVVLALTLIILVLSTGVHKPTVEYSMNINGVEHTYVEDHSLSKPVEFSIVGVIGTIIVLWVFGVLYFGRMLNSLAQVFKIKEFESASETWFILQYGIVLWIPLSFVAGLGLIIEIILFVLFAYYLFSGYSKLPYKIEVSDNNIPQENTSQNNSSIVY